MREVAANVEEYLAGLSPRMRKALERLRKKVRALAPDAEEVISYGMPTFKLHGRAIAYFAAFKDHCSFFPGSAIVEAYQKELKGFKTSKGTIQFMPEHPIPDALVEKIVREKIKQNTASKKKRG